MLWTGSLAVEVLAWILVWQHHSAPSAEGRLAVVAAHLIVPALSYHCVSATRTLTNLISSAVKIDELPQELSLVCPCLCSIHSIHAHLLIPTADLVIVKQATLTRRKMIVSRDFLIALPAEVNATVPAFHLVAALSLLDGRCAPWTISCHLLQMS